MAKDDRSIPVTVKQTLWGTEVRIILTPRESRDLLFALNFAGDEERIKDSLADALRMYLHQLAWTVAGHVQVFPVPPGEEGFSGPRF